MTPVQLFQRLQTLCTQPLSIKISNGSTYVRATRTKGGLKLSIHRMFLHAPTPVLEALIRFAMKPDRASRTVIRQMAHLFFTRIEPPSFDASLSDSRGRYIDLQELYDQENLASFGGRLSIPIAWFPIPCYRRISHITFGTYDKTLHLIRINGILDHPEVPLSFVRFIVYHEMLHADCQAVFDRNGRLCVHNREFKRREALHPLYPFAKQFEKESLKFFKRILRHGRP